ncbi:MAG TPA: hypothetical protein VJ549_09425 [Geothrix sp.]|nr:hypothetical protein [Geothrix sp.]
MEAKAKPGFEGELASIRNAASTASGPEREKLIARFSEITIPPFSSLGAPIVGIHEVANAWLLEQHRARMKSPPSSVPSHLPRDEEENQLLQAYTGYHVLQLLPDCDGFPVYTNAYMYEGPDRTSFRAQFLHDCVAVVGEDFLEQAYVRKSPTELINYGEAILNIARAYALKHGCAYLESTREPPETAADSPATLAHILFSAAKWCRYWGSRGYGLEPDF